MHTQPDELRTLRAGLRRRYSDAEILAQLRASAERLGRSPTMREFAQDRHATMHPQTVVGRFGSWNQAKRAAGLPPRRFATPAELLTQLRGLGEELGRIPTARDLAERRASMPSKSLYWHVFGSFRRALREAGFDVPLGEERLERAVEQGARLAQQLRHLPRFADWAQAQHVDARLPSPWQVRRLAGDGPTAWSSFQDLVRARLVAAGATVGEDGRVRSRRV